MDPFVVHACEQVLRFTRAKEWSDLTEERKVQLGFNMGVMALGLNLVKEQSYQFLADARESKVSMQTFHTHLQSLIASHKVEVDEAKVMKEF